MSDYAQAVTEFYKKNLSNTSLDKSTLVGDCPFCPEKGMDGGSKLAVIVNPESFFLGFFRCLNRCVPGGFPLWYSSLAKLDPELTPGFDPDREYALRQTDYPVQSINQEIKSFQDNLTDTIIEHFGQSTIKKQVLSGLSIGYNGRYIVYPYFQEDGNCYTARCVNPDRAEDFFWHGDTGMKSEQFQIFNVQEIQRCENGALVLCEGEENLLTLKQMGLPGIAVPDSQLFETIETNRFEFIRTLFIVVANNAESELRARALASRIGYKVRLLNWSAGLPRNYNLWQLAQDKGSDFPASVISMARSSKAFSPFASPRREHDRFFEQIKSQQSDAYANLRSGFTALDDALNGMHGINVFGGPPKAGKSCFMIQVGTEMACRGVPVLYYDFENGRQKIYQRTMTRLSRIEGDKLVENSFSEEEQKRFRQAHGQFKKMLNHFRVVNDRALSPEIMRRHIDFIKHETRQNYCVVIIDSLHKLPFKDFSERRTGIDAWLRQFESIRDEHQVSFLIISELTRGDKGAYDETPHMGIFKGSGDIEYSADNALVLYPETDAQKITSATNRSANLWLVASREHSPGLVAAYRLEYPYWGFKEVE
ncbi:MAG: AAA family ATPase [Desulfofustis sp.]|nr:AAA family ATPase [Desulfofustis sp.]